SLGAAPNTTPAFSRRRRSAWSVSRLSRAITFLIDSRISSTEGSPSCRILPPLKCQPRASAHRLQIGNVQTLRRDVNGPARLRHRIGIAGPVPDIVADAVVVLCGIVERPVLLKPEIACFRMAH